MGRVSAFPVGCTSFFPNPAKQHRFFRWIREERAPPFPSPNRLGDRREDRSGDREWAAKVAMSPAGVGDFFAKGVERSQSFFTIAVVRSKSDGRRTVNLLLPGIHTSLLPTSSLERFRAGVRRRALLSRMLHDRKHSREEATSRIATGQARGVDLVSWITTSLAEINRGGSFAFDRIERTCSFPKNELLFSKENRSRGRSASHPPAIVYAAKRSREEAIRRSPDGVGKSSPTLYGFEYAHFFCQNERGMTRIVPKSIDLPPQPSVSGEEAKG